MTSSIPATRAHLVSILKAAFPPDQTQVGYGAPRVYERHEVLSLMGTDPIDKQDRALGGQGVFRDEEYTLNLVLKVFKGGSSTATAEKVEERAWEMFATVEETVNANRSPSVLPSGWWGVSAASSDGTELTAAEGNEGWMCVIDVSLFCHARVQS